MNNSVIERIFYEYASNDGDNDNTTITPFSEKNETKSLKI